jgi:molecular chaperone DnaJ
LSQKKIKMKKRFYEILGISKCRCCSNKESYRKKALEHHPDKTLETNRQKFKVAAEAYEVLSDPNKKKQIRSIRSSSFDGSGGFGGGGGHGGMNMDDILVNLEIFSVAPLVVAAVDWRRRRRSTQN